MHYKCIINKKYTIGGFDMQTFIGVDDGNFDTKTQHTISPNGYTVHTSLPPMAREYLNFNGKYYLPSTDRFNYMEDKTLSERALILALFGISKELLFLSERCKGENLQDKISKYTDIALGAGLPPLHWATAAAKKNYYEKYMKDGISYEYNNFHFSFRVNFCRIFPQNYAALITNGKNEIISSFRRYFGVDIGGGTMETVFVENGLPIVNNCTTDNVGILYMFQFIIYEVKRGFNNTITNSDIEDILMSSPTCILEKDVKDAVMLMAQKWVDEKIIDKLVQLGINFNSTPTLFFGGGSLLLKQFIKNNKLIKNYHFLSDPVRANARGYAILVKQEFMDAKKAGKE